MIKTIIFDADGTLLEVENPYLAIARGLNCEDTVIGWVREYLDGKKDYETLVAEEESLFKKRYEEIYKENPKTGDLERFFYPPRTRGGAEELFKWLDKNKISAYILSTGFYYLIKDLFQLDVKKNHIYSNRLLYDTEGDFMGIKLNVKGNKIDGVDQIVSESNLTFEELVYVGDNAFDLPVIRYVLEKGGWVFLFGQGEKDFKIDDIPMNERLILISGLNEIAEKISTIHH